MTNEERDIQRKLKVLQHAEKIGNARKACRYFGVGRSSFYRWRDAYQKHGEAGLKNAKSIPKNPANQTPAEIVDKVLYLRRKYHLGPIRIVWYLLVLFLVVSLNNLFSKEYVNRDFNRM